MSSRPRLEIVNVSDTGRRRPHNEDSSITDGRAGLAVVADGMGGYKAGEVASAIAAMTILQHVQRGLRRRPNGADDAPSPEAALMRAAVLDANERIFRTAQAESQCAGMGTTVVAVLFHGDRLSVAHVGDSRLYRLRDGQLERITSDHSLVQELVDRGFFTPEEAEENTPRNLVTRALGVEPEVEVDIGEEAVRRGDVYLLCSDGLNDMVSDEEIHLTLGNYANLSEAANELVRLANERGGKDNITVILIRVQ